MQDPVNTALGKARVSVKLVLIGSERYFGPGICELLEKIDDSGSIQAAAKQMNMSYTKAWKILNRAEKEMNCRSEDRRTHFPVTSYNCKSLMDFIL